MQPLDVTGVPLRVSGFATLILPNGTDGFGVQTLAELETDSRLTLDLGKLVADRPDLFGAFVGYRFWFKVCRSGVGKFRRIFHLLLPTYLQSHVHGVHGCPRGVVAVDSWTRD